MASLAGKFALCTGSSSGIGLGVAKALAGRGCAVALHGSRPREDASECIEEVRSQKPGVQVEYFRADLSQRGAARQLVEEAIATFGRLDILVNNAGMQHVAPIDEFPDEAWDRLIAVNLTAAFETSKAAIPAMRSAGWGRIINITSVHGSVASANKAAYVASKHALEGLSKVTALDTAGSGITCNTIAPGWVATPLVLRQVEARAEAKGTSQEDEAKALVSEKQPLARFITPEELGAAVVFLASEAANSMTGSSLKIDGGWTAV